ncbi:MAG: hypothetical protein ABSF65_06570 [Candidatus Bathyarchaeia archaeon]
MLLIFPRLSQVFFDFTLALAPNFDGSWLVPNASLFSRLIIPRILFQEAVQSDDSSAYLIGECQALAAHLWATNQKGRTHRALYEVCARPSKILAP